MRSPALVVLAAGTLSVLCACSHRARDEERARAESVSAAADVRKAEPRLMRQHAALGPGDIRILNADSSVDLDLVGDSISAGLSEHTLAKVREKTDTNKVSGSGLGASFERMVKATVASTIGTRVVIPITSIRDVRYANGRLELETMDGKPLKLFEDTKTNGKPLMESFAPADAQRFVEAFRERKKSRDAF